MTENGFSTGQENAARVHFLIEQGATVHCPQSIEISDKVDIKRISVKGLVLHSGCRIRGGTTFIGDNVTIGSEGPVTIEDCQIGPDSEIKSGFLQKTVLLGRNSVGSGAHFREGTILEEEANVAHTVGLKQTILFPFVTLGSLINFCDVFMAGGTSRQNHSEVGSSYIHFNYTPNQDKATPSLIGDVPNGVMLNQRPVFLGGQGGLVGPTILAYGTVTAAGTICRKDQLKPGRLIIEGKGRGGSIPYNPEAGMNVKRIVRNNAVYIANLFALMAWYRYVRILFISGQYPQALHDSLLKSLQGAIDERVNRLGNLLENLSPISKESVPKITACHDKMTLQRVLSTFNARPVCSSERDLFLTHIQKMHGTDNPGYIDTIKDVDPKNTILATTWLQAIVNEIMALLIKSS